MFHLLKITEKVPIEAQFFIMSHGALYNVAFIQGSQLFPQTQHLNQNKTVLK